MIDESRRLWLLLSPALPVGGYSYSQGLEFAVASSQVSDLNSARRWIRGVATEVLPKVDLPLLLRMLRALRRGDLVAYHDWNCYLLALRETSELRAEDLAMGRALQRLLGKLQDSQPRQASYQDSELLAQLMSADGLTFAGALAFAAVSWQLNELAVCDACAWIWCENQVAAAVKLIPLGHSDGQRLLLELADELSGLTRLADECSDDDLGMTATGLAIASARHEHQPARLFRS